MPVALLPETLLNTITDGPQRAASDAVLAGGRTVGAWIDESSGAGVAKLRLVGPDGAPTTGEITVGAATEVVVAPLAGGFVVVRINQLGQQQTEIVAQRYDLVGEPLAGGATVIESTDFRNTPTLFYRAVGLEVTSLSDGGFAAGWGRITGDSSGRSSVSVAVSVADPAGRVEGSDIRVLAPADRFTIGYNPQVELVELPNHQLLANWRQEALSGSSGSPTPSGEMAQFYTLAGAPVGAPLRLDPSIPADGGPVIDSTNGLSVAALPNGQVVYAWSAGGSVWISLYPADKLGLGNFTGRTPPIRLTTTAGAGEPQVAVLEDGRFVVGWNDNGDVMAQTFTGAGQAQGTAFRLGVVDSGVQEQLRLASDDGLLAAVWQDASGQPGSAGGADASGGGVKLQLLAFELYAQGTREADTLTGGAANDSIVGGASDDRLTGAAGNDTLDGGVGGDILDGGPGSDLLRGGENFDFTTYEAAPSAVSVDLLAGSATGGLGPDTLSSVEGVYGSAFNDRFLGNYLSNLFVGNGGDDTVEGQSGSNYLDGGSGNDVLILFGKLSDYFVTNRTGQGATLLGPYGTDTVLNFERVQVGGQTLAWSDFASQAFNGLRYIASNPDLIAAYGADAEKGRTHWTLTGQMEGRALASFDPLRYAASNPDLLAQFGIDTEALTRHYITTGFAAGRSAVSFDAFQYGAVNPDLLLALGTDEAALVRHYAAAGFVEHRATSGFDPLEYGASNDDLARFYGADANALFQNWIHSGVFEGRPTNTFDGLQYAAANDDLARVYGTDARGALLHYLVAGADEGRATSGFDPVAYLLSYDDLGRLGLGAQGAFNHWLTIGADEGRRGDELFGREQASHALSGIVSGELKNFTTSGRFSQDRDWYQVDLQAGRTATISAYGADTGRGTLIDTRLELYDVTGRLIAIDEDSGVGRDATLVFTPGSSGIYYVVIRATGGAEGTYQIELNPAAGAPDEGWIV